MNDYVPPLRERDCGAGAMTRECSEAERILFESNPVIRAVLSEAKKLWTEPEPPISFASLRRITNRMDRGALKARLREGRPDWYKIRNNVVAGTADVYIYDEIGYFGITAQQFVDELSALNVQTINLHINSPGGEVYDGIAIYNTLRQHRATVNVYVDGVAASIASVIAMAGDTVTMGQGAHMMIHEAQGLALGPASEFRKLADELDAHTRNIAGFYQARAGGDVEAWLSAMAATTWYTAEDAVTAGLADSVASGARPADTTIPQNQWDLSIFGGVRASAARSVPVPARPTEPSEPDEPEWNFSWDPGLVRAAMEVASERVDAAAVQHYPAPDPEPTNPDEAWGFIDPGQFHNALKGGLGV